MSLPVWGFAVADLQKRHSRYYPWCKSIQALHECRHYTLLPEIPERTQSGIKFLEIFKTLLHGYTEMHHLIIQMHNRLFKTLITTHATCFQFFLQNAICMAAHMQMFTGNPKVQFQYMVVLIMK